MTRTETLQAELDEVRKAGATARSVGAVALVRLAEDRAARILGELIDSRRADAAKARNAHLGSTARGGLDTELADELADRRVAAAEEAANSPILGFAIAPW